MSDSHGVPVDVEARLSYLERLVRDAKPVPLSASVMVNRAEVVEVLASIRDTLPEEVTQARWVVKERDDILERAGSDAGRLIEDAEAERDRLVSEQEVMRTARRDADRILEEAQEQARQMRLEAEDYVDAKLANFEVVLHKTLGAVEKGRAKLRGRLDTDQLADDLDDELAGEA
jgi:cell division septum initiation protein DivIVA